MASLTAGTNWTVTIGRPQRMFRDPPGNVDWPTPRYSNRNQRAKAADSAVPGLPDGLLWDERYGWAAAVESAACNKLVIVTYRGEDVLPPPDMVAAFAGAACRGYPGRPDVPWFRQTRGVRRFRR